MTEPNPEQQTNNQIRDRNFPTNERSSKQIIRSYPVMALHSSLSQFLTLDNDEKLSQ